MINQTHEDEENDVKKTKNIFTFSVFIWLKQNLKFGVYYTFILMNDLIEFLKMVCTQTNLDKITIIIHLILPPKGFAINYLSEISEKKIFLHIYIYIYIFHNW